MFYFIFRLSGEQHEVISGLCVMVRDGDSWKSHILSESTTVQFAKLPSNLISAYINTGEPM